MSERLRVAFRISLTLWVSVGLTQPVAAQVPTAPGRHLIHVPSSVGGNDQSSYLILPPNYRPGGDPIPIVVSLHTWSYDVEQRNETLEQAVQDKGWMYLFPDFRGRNDHPEACGSDLAKGDVIDALDWVLAHYAVDRDRVYLTGTSGGGFMTLAMVVAYPEKWTAASAWVPLSDMEAWYDFHAGDDYGEMTRQCVGGDPRVDGSAKEALRRRSPLYQMGKARDVALDIAAGRFDGHDGAPIPVWHSLEAFNQIAQTTGEATITAQEIAELSRHDPHLESPRASDRVVDESFGREIFLRRYAGRARVTIFEGGHEGITSATMGWFEAHAGR